MMSARVQVRSTDTTAGVSEMAKKHYTQGTSNIYSNI